MNFVLFFLTNAFASMEACPTTRDRLEKDTHVYLVTIAGTPAPWQSFGHSTLWISDGRNNTDLSYNWGTFDPNQQNLLGSFLQGTMNYWLNAVEFRRDFLRYTKYEERTFIAQRLHLSQEQAAELSDILREESQPENRMFTYDWATKSCATKIRDRLNSVLDDQLLHLKDLPAPRTMRQEGLRYLNGKPELWFLWDRSISYSADQPVTLWDTAYSPYMLSQIFDQVRVQDGETKVPFVDYSCTIDGTHPMPPEDPPAHHWPLGIFSICTATLLGFTSRKKSLVRTVVLSSFGIGSLLIGVLVTIHTLLWFSKLSYLHPNTNTLMSGPQILLWAWVSLKILRNHEPSSWVVRAVQFFSTIGILISLWEISPYGIQDNTAQICLFLPFHILALYLTSKSHTS